MTILPETAAMTECTCNGFWTGVWHGIISPISAIASAFNDDVAIYMPNGNPGYSYGFVLGASAVFVVIALKLWSRNLGTPKMKNPPPPPKRRV